MPSLRPAAVAGLFYPADPAQLGADIDAYLAQARPPAAAGPIKALIVPHAGYVYSAPIAATAYAALAPQAGRIRRVILLGPTHRVAVRGLAVPTVDSFATPLGPLPIDAEARQRIADLPQVVADDGTHALEHSLEVQLPFLQRLLGPFTLLPLAVGAASGEAVAQVLERLWGGEETLILVSSDLSHYQPYAEAERLDQATCARIAAARADLAPREACGAIPINGLLLAAARHGLRPRLLDRRNSGDTAGDRERVVGYAAFALESNHGPH